MRTGFIFNINKCVNCGACSAACMLENGGSIHFRKIFSSNPEAIPSLPLENLSLACNHCETTPCLEACPASAFYREPLTGAVIIYERKCIGCKYCQWNCPYDAPKFDRENGIIGKCNLCHHRLIEGQLPACTSGCPTGALEFGEIPETTEKNGYPWFPEKFLNPAIMFTGVYNKSPLRIIPEHIFETGFPVHTGKDRTIRGEMSLIAFTFLTTISVSSVITTLINGKYPGKIFFVLEILFAGLLSMFHIGRQLRAWRALANLKSSVLSREIALFLLYSVISVIAVSVQLPGLLLTAGIAGLLLLISIDSVYIYSDKRNSDLLKSGQTFISALLIVSFFNDLVIPFLFLAGLKLLSSAYSLFINRFTGFQLTLRFVRIALLLIAGASLVSDISYADQATFSVFLIGELIDRIVFYIDFSPVSINTEIIKQANFIRDEKKSG